MLRVGSSVLGAADHKPQPASPFADADLVRYGSAMATVAAAAVLAFVAADVPEPCIVGPIPSLRSVDFHHPFQRRPLESCKVVFLHSAMFLACLALSYVAPTAKTPVLSSPLLASVYPPLL